MRVALLLMLGLTLGAGCAWRTPVRRAESLETPTGHFMLAWPDTREGDAERVRQAVRRATPRIARWGSLREPVELEIFSRHEHLETAADRPGYGWLRAWSRYDQVFLQAPSTWGLVGATQAQVDELLAHELTHCLMYQLASDRLGWTRKQIPVWFREGMASYTAEQQSRRGSLEDLARWMQKHPEKDVLSADERLYRDEEGIVYAAAHHAFTFLVRRYGEEAVRELLREMKRGPVFDEAFTEVIGLTHEGFRRDFTRYVRWRGFRGGRLLPRSPARPLAKDAEAGGEAWRASP